MGVLGAVIGGAGAAIMLALGDRLHSGDPAGLMVGAGGIGLAGALLGALVGRATGDGPGSPTRLGRATVGLEFGPGSPAVLDERHPPSLMIGLAPTVAMEHGFVRLLASFGGLVGTRTEVDPSAPPTASGGFPVALRERELRTNLGLEIGVRLPYPVLRTGSSYLGRLELRYKPELQLRQETFELGDDGTRRELRRMMVLPLTVGVRWHLSDRQRVTFLAGPRFDFVAYGTPEHNGRSQGRAIDGPIYGEATYDIDVPISLLLKKGSPRVAIDGLVRLGYVHTRFDGLGFNIGGAIGFAGPLQIAWHLRLSPRSSPVAFQGSIGTWIGNGLHPFLTLGAALPEIRTRKARAALAGP